MVVVGNLLGSDNGGILGIGERPVGDSGLCSGGQWGRDFEIPPGLNCTLVTPETLQYTGGPGDPPTCTALEKGISYHPLR